MGARQWLADALMSEADGRARAGERKRATELSEEASRIYTELGEPLGVAQALMRRAHVRWDAGELIEARALYDQAIAKLEALGADEALAVALKNRAGVDSSRGEDEISVEGYRRALVLYERVDDPSGRAACETGVGITLQHAGRWAEAEASYLRGLALTRMIGQRISEAIVLENLVSLALDRGQLREASQRTDETLALYQAINDQTGLANAKAKQARIAHLMGDLPRAEHGYNEALQLLDRLGEKMFAAHKRREQSALLVDLGRLGEAEAAARSALQAFEAQQVATGRGWAQAQLALVLLAGKRTAEARAVVDDAQKTRKGDILVETSTAAVELAEGKAELAVKRLEALLVHADRLPYPEALDARVLLARAQAQAGRAAIARRTRSAAEADGRSRGFAVR